MMRITLVAAGIILAQHMTYGGSYTLAPGQLQNATPSWESRGGQAPTQRDLGSAFDSLSSHSQDGATFYQGRDRARDPYVTR